MTGHTSGTQQHTARLLKIHSSLLWTSKFNTFFLLAHNAVCISSNSDDAFATNFGLFPAQENIRRQDARLHAKNKKIKPPPPPPRSCDSTKTPRSAQHRFLKQTSVNSQHVNSCSYVGKPTSRQFKATHAFLTNQVFRCGQTVTIRSLRPAVTVTVVSGIRYIADCTHHLATTNVCPQ